MHVFEKNSTFFDLLSEAVAEGIFVINEKHEIVAINKHALKLFGYKEVELIGKPLSKVLPERNHEVYEGLNAVKPKKRKILNTNVAKNLVGITKSGLEFPLDINLITFKILDRSYFLALVYDVTQNRKQLAALRINSKAMDAALNGITITDATKEDNPIIFANKAIEKISGYSQKEILDKNCRFLQNGDTDQPGVKEMRKAISKGKSCRVQLRNYRKDGRMFWNEVSINPIKNEKGVITHFVGIQNDITKRKTIEEENRQLIRIFNESDNEIYVFDAISLRFKHVNFGARRNTGYKLREFMKMTPLDLKPNFSEVEFRKLLIPLLKAPGRKTEFETVHKRKDGSTYPVEVHLQSSKVGEKCLMSSVILDITDKREYTHKLEKKVAERTKQLRIALSREKELNELKSKFLSMVSHEFKTPLSAILTSAILVGKYENTDTQDKREKHLNSIISGVHHLTDILNDFLAVERLEKGEDFYKYTKFSLSKVVNEVLYNANLMLKKGQRINYPMNIEEVSICQDEKIVLLTLTNLLSNAIKYSPEDTEIDLLTKFSDHSVQFEVIDQGIGIPEKDQKHIFEKNFRAGNILTTQGTGIGLHIVKTHVETLGGQVYFSSKENKGSKFTVVFPISEEPCTDKDKKGIGG